MSKRPELLERQGAATANSDYLMEYQKAVLLALEKEGLLDHTQLKECITKLEQIHSKNAKSKSL
ncbi:hypothetical protein [Dysosmobacter sp.]